MDKILLRSDQNEIAILTLNSPKNLNALSDAMLDELKLTFEEIEQSKDIKAVIIKAAGRAFCPGHDLKEMQEKRNLELGLMLVNGIQLYQCVRVLVMLIVVLV